MAEVDGNRTRRTGIARPNRFEGGGAHQVPGHLPDARPGEAGRATRLGTLPAASPSVEGMRKLILLAVVVGLSAFAAKKLRAS
jgi:hypothetical protein